MYRFCISAAFLFAMSACDAPAPQGNSTQPKPTKSTVSKQVAPPTQNCQVGQQITLNISSTAAQGEGCQEGGGKAQNDSVHVYIEC